MAEQAFILISQMLLRMQADNAPNTFRSKFLEHFGVKSGLATRLWTKMYNNLPDKAGAKHL